MLDRRKFIAGAAAATAMSGVGLGASATTAESSYLELGGPQIAPELMPQVVRVKRDFVPGSIIVVSSRYHLYFITKTGQAIRYGVAVGRGELVFRGEAMVGRKVEWPSWKPTPAMIERNPAAYARYAEGMPGGPNNPLGARALYLFQNGHDTAVRIHGTIEPQSIGQSVSNGCIRMVNEHVIDLYNRVALGAPVSVY
ncbi:L,D-transpeptidase [Ostreiculturibacter nitratireducens]|uniref:L,D-transpeptidase n=1 Tax=Ostreiculturibacter nitratireducens TaxID=3075226 RepID=UPI0031B57605